MRDGGFGGTSAVSSPEGVEEIGVIFAGIGQARFVVDKGGDCVPQWLVELVK